MSVPAAPSVPNVESEKSTKPSNPKSQSLMTDRSLVSALKLQEKKSDDKTVKQELDPVLEVNEEVFDRPYEEGHFVEIDPRIFAQKDIVDRLNVHGLNNAIYELGVINLCWPEIEEPVFETRTCFPVSYYTNSPKERLLLAYAESFRRQFRYHYKHYRKALFLQAPNECGMQKMVCSSLRKTRVCYDGTNTWQGLAALVSDYFDYEPLTKPMLHPERLMSPYTCIVRRSGNPFEIAHVLVSWLLGAGFDAYVVHGCATRDTCMNIRYRTVCPDIPDETEVVEEVPPPEEEPRYKLMDLPDFNSKYVLAQEAAEAKKKQDEQDRLEAERLARIADLEKPPPDAIDGWRTHAWVLILAGPMGITEPFFIEPSQGCGYPLNEPIFQSIQAVYNNRNYYANVQGLHKKKVEGEEESVIEDLSLLNYDLSDLHCWQHLLAGEPFSRRMIVGADYNDPKSAVDTDKHLDVPRSWVEKLDITANDYEQRYPGSHKVVHYKKVLLEKFAKYSERDGIVKRVKIFEDYALTEPVIFYEYYSNREDRMITRRIDHQEQEICETFLMGRPDQLTKHTYSMDTPPTAVESYRTMEFNWYGRTDHLNKVVCTPLTFDEFYTHRDDRLECRYIIYEEGTKADPRRKIMKVTEMFHRDPSVPANLDVWTKIYNIHDSTILLLYHYGYNFVSNDTRFYNKPNLAETGGKILFYPDKTSGYIADPCGKATRPLQVYYTLCENIETEYRTTKGVRDREIDINVYLTQRHKELTEPELYVSLFNTERNETAQKGWQEQELKKAEMEEREKEAEIDPLAPYLARMFGDGHGTGQPLTVKEATLVREQCINDFRSKMLARQVIVQERYDKLNAEYKAKRLWYLANQFILSPEKESAYFATSAELSFQVHALEVRLTRHRDLSSPRFKALMDYLEKHPLLSEYNRAKTFMKTRGPLAY